MKNTITRWMIAAAALAVVAGSASAQTYKAEVPLSFHVGGKLMQPGSYRVEITGAGGNGVVILHNDDTNQGAALVGMPNVDVSKAWQKAGTPMLAFACVESTCVLQSMWNGRSDFAYRFPELRKHAGEVRIAVVRLTPMKAD